MEVTIRILRRLCMSPGDAIFFVRDAQMQRAEVKSYGRRAARSSDKVIFWRRRGLAMQQRRTGGFSKAWARACFLFHNTLSRLPQPITPSTCRSQP